MKNDTRLSLIDTYWCLQLGDYEHLYLPVNEIVSLSSISTHRTQPLQLVLFLRCKSNSAIEQ